MDVKWIEMRPSADLDRMGALESIKLERRALIGVDELLVIMSIYGNDVHVWYYLME